MPDFNKDYSWKKLSIEAEKEIEKLKYFIKKCQDDLLLNQEVEFIPKIVANQNIFGDLKLDYKHIIDENRSEGTIRLVVDNFSMFKDGNQSRENKDWNLIKNIPWRIQAKMEQTKDFNNALGFYIKPVCENDILKENPIRISAKYRIIQHKDQIKVIYIEDVLEHQFEYNVGYGFPEFISLKDIMDNCYCKQNDSITLEASIRIIK